jgi:hypothetical protein
VGIEDDLVRTAPSSHPQPSVPLDPAQCYSGLAARHRKPHILRGPLSTPDVAYPSPWGRQTCSEARILGSKPIIHSPRKISNAGHLCRSCRREDGPIAYSGNSISRAESPNTSVHAASLCIRHVRINSQPAITQRVE